MRTVPARREQALAPEIGRADVEVVRVLAAPEVVVRAAVGDVAVDRLARVHVRVVACTDDLAWEPGTQQDSTRTAGRVSHTLFTYVLC